MDYVKKLAEDHVTWYQASTKPQLIDNFIHGYKHGYQDALEACERESEENEGECSGMPPEGAQFHHDGENGWRSDGIYTEQKDCAKAWNDYDKKYVVGEGP